jgi:uncharacterized protein GlcG (DUF336 family)
MSHCSVSGSPARLSLAAAAALTLTLAGPADAQLIQRRDLSYAMALTIATGALDACKAMGYAISAVVVDRDGETMVALRGDNAGLHTLENARRKAYTARTFRTTTSEYVKGMKDNPVRQQQITLPNIIAIDGGVPIKVGSDTIAGVGVSGSPGKDEECVNAGIAKVQQLLQ